ncbi:PadR family transcriptional regulator [Candidatus Allofournierella excrementavium]|uniref:PadR family transcriptional regulator n=1 Tax=Candidatus Allofournierella excrementavium TaxID=2838591 RepID=UPI003A863CB9
MEYLILGLLLLAPMTGYELQRFIKQNLALICSSSAGSVQTALTKLEKEGRIAAAETVEGRRRKKTFSITPAGRQAFAAWVARPMQAGKVKNMELARLFFLGLAQPAQRAAAIREQFRKAQAGPLPPGQNWDEVFRFQGCTIEYGIADAEFERQWYSGLLKELEEEE